MSGDIKLADCMRISWRLETLLGTHIHRTLGHKSPAGSPGTCRRESRGSQVMTMRMILMTMKMIWSCGRRTGTLTWPQMRQFRLFCLSLVSNKQGAQLIIKPDLLLRTFSFTPLLLSFKTGVEGEGRVTPCVSVSRLRVRLLCKI